MENSCPKKRDINLQDWATYVCLSSIVIHPFFLFEGCGSLTSPFTRVTPVPSRMYVLASCAMEPAAIHKIFSLGIRVMRCVTPIIYNPGLYIIGSGK
jgi:hypothetical protein